MHKNVKQCRNSIEALEPRSLLSVARPAYNTGTGFFTLDGNLYDSNGNAFVMKGPNVVHAWGSYAANYNTIDQIAKTGANAARLVTYRDIISDTGNPYTDAADTVAERKETIERYLANGLVPIIEDHASIADSASQSNPVALNEIVTHWLENVSWLKQYEQYVILNIANEWGPPANANGSNTVWRDNYITQVQRLRAGPDGNLATTADNINATIMIDSGGYGQDLYTIEHHADDVLAADPQRNIIFSIHLYGSWRDESRPYELSSNPSAGYGPWNIATRLAAWKNRPQPLTIAIGEFAWEDFKDFGATSSPYGAYRTRRVLEIADQLDIGWLGWSWNQSSPNTLNMTSGASVFNYNSNTDLSRWGDLLINDPVLGMKASATRATFFPVAGLPNPTSAGFSPLPVALPPDTFIVIDRTLVGVAESGSNAVQVRLSKQPANNIAVSLARVSGDTGLNLLNTSLTFSPGNWSQYQTVVLTAAGDANATADTAKFQLSAAGLASTDFTAKEIEPPATAIGNVFTINADRDRLLSPATSGSAAAVTVTAAFYTPENNPDATGTFYLRFPISTVTGNITNATLRVFTTNTTANLRVRAFASLGDGWQETTGTGSNSTPIYASYPLHPTGSTSGYLLPTTGGAYLEINSAALTEFVKSEALRDGMVSIALRLVSGSASFQTDEGTNRPQLVVTSNEAVAPSVTASAFDALTAAHGLRISFTENVGGSLAAGDLVLVNDTNPGASVLVTAPTFDAATSTALFTFAPSVIPDGRYTATLAAGTFADAAGNLSVLGATFNFAFLLGDANADAAVDLDDFTTLAAGFGQPRPYSGGDFNYDGSVSLDDFTILASQFGESLPQLRASASAGATSPNVPATNLLAATQQTTTTFGVRSIGRKNLAEFQLVTHAPSLVRDIFHSEELP